MDIRWAASSVCLSLSRVMQKRETSRDRGRLTDLGDRLCNLGKGEVLGLLDYEEKQREVNCMTDTYEGVGLAVLMEEEYLQGEERSESYLARLREIRVVDLRALGELFRKARSSEEFDVQAEAVRALMDDWKAYAEEFVALWPRNRRHVYEVCKKGIMKVVAAA